MWIYRLRCAAFVLIGICLCCGLPARVGAETVQCALGGNALPNGPVVLLPSGEKNYRSMKLQLLSNPSMSGVAVQVNWSDHVEAEEDSGDGGWDLHYRNFQIMQDRLAPWLDQAVAGLLTDLRQRGLLESTLVVAVGEFGRTPRINDKAGRDHWEHCYSALVAGGGTRGGRVIGESDQRAERVRDRPLTPADLAATIHQAVGISSEMAQTLGVAVNGRVIDELF